VEYDDHLMLAFMNDAERPLQQLAAAIRRGDTQDAELWLDRIVGDLGPEAEEQVQQGRYSSGARASA